MSHGVWVSFGGFGPRAGHRRHTRCHQQRPRLRPPFWVSVKAVRTVEKTLPVFPEGLHPLTPNKKAQPHGLPVQSLPLLASCFTESTGVQPVVFGTQDAQMLEERNWRQTILKAPRSRRPTPSKAPSASWGILRSMPGLAPGARSTFGREIPGVCRDFHDSDYAGWWSSRAGRHAIVILRVLGR